MPIPPVFDLDAFGQRWHVTFLPGSPETRTVLERVSSVWRARAGNVFVEVEHIADEERKALERRLVAAISGLPGLRLP
jgi:hypothetical protein